jgi:hypothetical protein
MLEVSRSANNGARNSACRSRSRAESAFGSTMLILGSSLTQALECPADRLVGAGPHHLAPFVAGREEALFMSALSSRPSGEARSREGGASLSPRTAPRTSGTE